MIAPRPFARDGLPWLARSTAGRSARLARWLAHAGRTCLIRGLGTLEIRPLGVELEPTRGAPLAPRPSEELETFSLWRADARGELSFEVAPALRWVNALLGVGPPRVFRPLSRIERGVLASIAAVFLDVWRLDGSLGLAAPPTPHAPGADDVIVHFAARGPHGGGVVRLTVPLDWLVVGAPAGSLDAPPWLAFGAVVEVARTSVPRSDARGASPGDVVIFGGTLPVPHDASSDWPARIRVGSFSAPVSIDGRGDLGLRDRFTRKTSPLGAPMAADHDTSPEPRPFDDGGVSSEAPVEIVAEIGRVQVRLDELVGLTRGAVLSLGHRGRVDVTLTVQGQTWARGELVNVDDELAVRLLSVVRAL